MAEKAGGTEEKRKCKKKGFFFMLQNIFFTVDFVNRIPEHDAEYLKHLTPVKVKKLASCKLADFLYAGTIYNTCRFKKKNSCCILFVCLSCA